VTADRRPYKEAFMSRQDNKSPRVADRIRPTPSSVACNLADQRHRAASDDGTLSGADRGEIRFYRANEKPYGAFSNLFRRPIVFEGQEFATAEHAYQTGKARRPAVANWIRMAPTGALAAIVGHDLYYWEVVSRWSQIKYERMRLVLRAKFTQHEDLREILLSTGDARLVEARRNDNAVNRTWGEVDGRGLNKLGILLMELRSDLRSES
jgi:ribA/ribD-fused uncharacterized protein